MKLTTTLTIVALAALLTGCGKAGYASNDNTAGSNLAQSISTKLTQEELETLAKADQQELDAFFAHRSIIDPSDTTAALQIHLAGIGDLAAQFDILGDCPSSTSSSTSNQIIMTVSWDCDHVVGFYSQTNLALFMPGSPVPMFNIPQSRALDITITGVDGKAHLIHNYSGISGFIPTRSVDDTYSFGADSLSVKGQASYDQTTNVLTASYDVVKNSGDVDTVTVVLNGVTLNSSNLLSPLCGGSADYSTSSGLVYSKAFAACQIVTLPPGFPPGFPGPGIPGFPGFPGGTL